MSGARGRWLRSGSRWGVRACTVSTPVWQAGRQAGQRESCAVLTAAASALWQATQSWAKFQSPWLIYSHSCGSWRLSVRACGRGNVMGFVIGKEESSHCAPTPTFLPHLSFACFRMWCESSELITCTLSLYGVVGRNFSFKLHTRRRVTLV